MSGPTQAWAELVALDPEADQRGERLPALPFVRYPLPEWRDGVVRYLEDDDRSRLAHLRKFVFPLTPATCVHPVRFLVPDWMWDELAVRLVGLRMGVPERYLP